MATTDAFTLLEHVDAGQRFTIAVLIEEDAFLRQIVLEKLLSGLSEDDAVPPAAYEGDSTTWIAVYERLVSRSLFATGLEAVVVLGADSFVSANRAALEKYAAHPSATSMLILAVSTWPSNTRLYKSIDAAKDQIQIACGPPRKRGGKSPNDAAVHRWLTQRASSVHKLKLAQEAAMELWELVEGSFGRAEQELAKLALLITGDRVATPSDVRSIVGGWGKREVWEMIDSILDGKTADALTALHRLLSPGQSPLAVFGAMAWSLRRYGRAAAEIISARRTGRRIDVDQLLKDSGFRPWGNELTMAKARLKRLGQKRALLINRWLLETDLALKGSHSDDDRARLALERLVTRLA